GYDVGEVVVVSYFLSLPFFSLGLPWNLSLGVSSSHSIGSYHSPIWHYYFVPILLDWNRTRFLTESYWVTLSYLSQNSGFYPLVNPPPRGVCGLLSVMKPVGAVVSPSGVKV